MVQPAAKRKLLVFNRANGFRHSSIEIGSQAMQILGQKSGVWDTTITDDPAVFTADNLKQYDAVCFLNTTGDVFTPQLPKDATEAQKQEARPVGEARQQAFLDYVASGKGFIGIHAATDTAYNWSGYGDLIGGYFDGHPWGSGDEVSVRVEDPNHPLCRHLEGKNLDFKEEIYQMRDKPYSRQKQRVLLGLDLGRTKPKNGMKRKDNDYPISWVKTYGQGRVFYCSLGHREDKYWDPRVMQHYLAGIQFVMGDLKADTTPLPQPPVPALIPEEVRDAVLGEYQTAGPNGVLARMWPEGDNNYRTVVYAPNADGTTNRVELTGKLEKNQIVFANNDWAGTWQNNKLALTNAGKTLEFSRVNRTSPTLGQRPPQGAVVLLPFVPDTVTNLNEWQNAKWLLMTDGSVRVNGGDNKTKREFGDVKLHIEWMTPLMPGARGQGRANSGVYLQERYEVQILDSFGLDSKDNDAGGIYKVAKPKVNACLPPGVWQTYDITFRAPRLNADGSVAKPANATIVHNGITIHENLDIPNPTGGGASGNVAKGVIKLQDHGNPVRFRNIWVQELPSQP
jgi:type 1 glutamine amidotransferase